MGYNPGLAKGRKFKKRVTPTKYDGIKRSDRIRRDIGALNTGPRIQTPSGFFTPLFESKGFTVRNEVIAAGNNLGFGSNSKGDRYIQILRGALYISVDRNGNRAYEKFLLGGIFSAPKGTTYCLATSGTEDVEILVVESPNYQKNWKAESETGAVLNTGNFIAPEVKEEPAVPVIRNEAAIKEVLLKKAAKKNAKKQANASNTKKTLRDFTSVLGTNPRPLGPNIAE